MFSPLADIKMKNWIFHLFFFVLILFFSTSLSFFSSSFPPHLHKRRREKRKRTKNRGRKEKWNKNNREERNKETKSKEKPQNPLPHRINHNPTIPPPHLRTSHPNKHCENMKGEKILCFRRFFFFFLVSFWQKSQICDC